MCVHFNLNFILFTLKWFILHRFAQLTQAIIDENAVPLDRFVSVVLPGLIALSQDSVPNVRISVAKVLSQSLMNKGELRDNFQ